MLGAAGRCDDRQRLTRRRRGPQPGRGSAPGRVRASVASQLFSNFLPAFGVLGSWTHSVQLPS
jgi:hypothetical protein